MAARFTLGKKERLKSRKQIDDLFLKGKSFPVFPLRVTWLFVPAGRPELQAGVTVSKRNFKKAVHRNRIKRLLREAYRLEKEALLASVNEKSIRAHLFFMYVDKELTSFEVVREAMKTALKKLQQKLLEVNEVPR
jgi:ribonuclease P protein component